MKAYLTITQIWYNCSIFNFFFRTQARETLEEIHANIACTLEDERTLFDTIEENYDDLEELEEDLYNMSPKEFCDAILLDYPEEEEEEEEEEEK